VRSPDLALRWACAGAGAATSVLPLVAGTTSRDLAFVLVGALAAVAAVGPDRVGGHRRAWLSTGCLVGAVAHLAVHPVSALVAVVEAVLMAAYLALAAAAEVCRGAAAVLLRWAVAPVTLAVIGAAAAAVVSRVSSWRDHPLLVALAGLAATALLFAALQRRATATGANAAADAVRARRRSRERGSRPR
jgi:hypothetical protein